jgi:hypothetical protein
MTALCDCVLEQAEASCYIGPGCRSSLVSPGMIGGHLGLYHSGKGDVRNWLTHAELWRCCVI